MVIELTNGKLSRLNETIWELGSAEVLPYRIIFETVDSADVFGTHMTQLVKLEQVTSEFVTEWIETNPLLLPYILDRP